MNFGGFAKSVIVVGKLFSSFDELLSSLELNKFSTSELLITSEIVKHQIDIVNPYIKLLGTTDIMSDSKEKTPTESPE